MKIRVWWSVVVILLVAGWPMPAAAQLRTGNIEFRAVGWDGAPLADVEVTLGNRQHFFVQMTGTLGTTRFHGLAPGTYFLETSRSDLSGMGLNVLVTAGRTTEVSLELVPAGMIFAGRLAPPLLDRRRPGTGAAVERGELEISAALDLWGLLPTVPGVLTDRIGTGGRRIGLPSPVAAPGAPAEQTVWSLDGVILTDRATRGTFPLAIDLDSLEEVYATSGGGDSRLGGSGLSLNLITRRGINEWRASARSLAGDHASVRGLEGGGPLWPSRAWLWGSAARTELRDGALRTAALAFDGNAIESNSVAVRAWDGDIPETSRAGGSGFGGRPAVWKVEDTQTFLEGSTLSGLYARVDGPFPQRQARLDGETFFALGGHRHELVYGGSSRTVRGGQDGVDRTDGDISSLYGEEHLFFGGLTANLGLRWDRQSGRFGGASNTWSALTPRLGLTWTPGTSGRTLLSAGYSRLADLIGPGSAAGPVPRTDQVVLGAQYKLDTPSETAAGLQLTWRRTEDLEHRAATFSLITPLETRVMVRSFLTWQDGTPFDPQESASVQSRWSYGLATLYRIRPDRSWGFDTAATWTGRQGFPLASHQEDVHLLDLRVQKLMDWQGFLLTVSLDVLNALNHSIVLQSPAVPGSETLSPRRYRLGVRLSYN